MWLSQSRGSAHLCLQGSAKKLAKDADGGRHLGIHSGDPGGLQATHPSSNPGQVPNNHEGQHKTDSHLQTDSTFHARLGQTEQSREGSGKAFSSADWVELA